jgi:aryl carrier-like protein
MSVRAVRRDLGLSPRDEANALSQHALEETLVEIFKANLALDSVAIGDDYFALGGDSINAVALISEALEWGVAIELPELFENPNIAVSAEVILTHLAEGKVTHLGEDGGFQSRRDADPGASSGDSGFEQTGSIDPAGCPGDGTVTQYGTAVSARRTANPVRAERTSGVQARRV